MTTKTPNPKTRKTHRSQTPSRGSDPGGSKILLVAVVGAVLVAALVAVLVASLSDDTEDSGEPREFDVAEATVEGTALPPFPEAGADPAIGEPAPELRGEGLDGEAVVAPTPGHPTILLFAAHWCPHCQAEVPEVQEWLDEGNLPEDVDLITVSTGVDPERPNHPPSAWLEDESWSAPTLADGSGQAATAYGLDQFPYWAAVDADGNVVARLGGRPSSEQMEALVDAVR